MFGAEHFLTDGEGAAVERFGVAGAALLAVQRRQVVEAWGGVGVFGAERFISWFCKLLQPRAWPLTTSP